MGKKYPHLSKNGNSSAFPDVSGVRVFKYDNDMDYARFDHTQMVITCCHVPWDMGEVHVGNRAISGIGNVVYFEDAAARDAWFDSIPEGERYDWETKYRDLHANGEITLPLPFDIAAKFNYVRVQYTVLPGEGTPLMYEDEYGLREWFWFIRDVKEGASPNTSVLTIAPDAWQTFIYDFDVTGMMLERGHAPAFAVDVDDYLANPIDNNDYLLAEDVSFFEGTNAKSSKFFPVGNGEKLIAFALPLNLNGILTAGGKSWNGNATGPTFADNSYRDGHQYEVNDYAWRYGSVDLSNASLSLKPYYGRETPTSVKVFAIDPANALEFFTTLQNLHPHVMNAIEGVFMIPREDVTAVNHATFEGVEILEIQPLSSVQNIELKRADFGYPEHYAKLAKLYTFPYAEIEITDNAGKSAVVRVEQCGNLQYSKALLFSFPYIEYRATVEGYAGQGGVEFEWYRADNRALKQTAGNGEWAELLSKFDVPVYELRMTGQQANITDIWEDMQPARERAINAYHATMRQANTGYENTRDSNDTNIANTNRTSATNVANTQRSTSAMQTNVGASSSTEVANTATATATATNVGLFHNSQQNKIVGYNNNKIDTDAGIASHLTATTTSLQNGYAALAQSNSNGATVTSGLLSSASSVIGGITGLDIGGITSGVTSVTSMHAQMQAANANVLASIATDSNIASATSSATLGYASAAKTANNNVNAEAMAETSRTIEYNNASATEQVNRNAATNNANASRTKSAQDSNASASASTSNSNASASASTSNSNANYSRNASMYNAQDALRLAQAEQTAVFRKNALARPVKVGTRLGTGLDDAYGKRGIQVKVRTQPKGAIIQAGDYFLRYGYAYNAYWNFDGNWNVGEKFTYWKASDIWTNDTRLPDMYADRIRFFLLGGVTVWRRPEDIGRVTIYQNGL